jgi:hypothetical protein
MTLPLTIHNLAELLRTAELGMYRHYASARRSRRFQRGVSTFQIVVNVALGSAFLYAIGEELPAFAKWTGATLALLAAALGALESYFGFGESFERHHRVADEYRSIARECERIRTLFDDKLTDLSGVALHLSDLHKRYDRVTRGANDLLTRQADYREAVSKQAAREKEIGRRRDDREETMTPQ